jgi:hypothetical protein
MMRHVSIIAAGADSEGERIRRAIEAVHVVDGGRDGLEVLLGRLLAEPANATPCTLDLIGHSSTSDSLLLFGDWVIDATRRSVRAFFRGLADNDVFGRLGVQSLRLLGCQTAATARGRETIAVLSELIGIDVCGSAEMIHASQYDRGGFRDDFVHSLVSARDLKPAPRGVAAVGRRALDIEMLPSSPLGEWRQAWPRRVLDLETGRAILNLVQRNAGAQMVGTQIPICAIALPAIDRSGWYYSLQVLANYEFVRVHLDGDHCTGIVFPITDPAALRLLLDV